MQATANAQATADADSTAAAQDTVAAQATDDYHATVETEVQATATAIAENRMALVEEVRSESPFVSAREGTLSKANSRPVVNARTRARTNATVTSFLLGTSCLRAKGSSHYSTE